MYTSGIHWRGYVAYIAGILINIVGFVGAIGVKVPIGGTYIYNLNYFGGFIVAAIVYWGLCKISPIPACADTWTEVGDEIRNMSVAYDQESSSDIENGVFSKSAEVTGEQTRNRKNEGY